MSPHPPQQQCSSKGGESTVSGTAGIFWNPACIGQADRIGRTDRSASVLAVSSVLAPRETAAGTAGWSPDDVFRAGLDGSLDHVRRRIIKGHVTAILAIGHWIDEIADRFGIPGGRRPVKKRIDRDMAANQQSCGEKHKKQRGDDDGPRGCRVVPPHTKAFSRAKARAGMIRLYEPCSGVRAFFFGCVHRTIEHQND